MSTMRQPDAHKNPPLQTTRKTDFSAGGALIAVLARLVLIDTQRNCPANLCQSSSPTQEAQPGRKSNRVAAPAQGTPCLCVAQCGVGYKRHSQPLIAAEPRTFGTQAYSPARIDYMIPTPSARVVGRLISRAIKGSRSSPPEARATPARSLRVRGQVSRRFRMAECVEVARCLPSGSRGTPDAIVQKLERFPGRQHQPAIRAGHNLQDIGVIVVAP